MLMRIVLFVCLLFLGSQGLLATSDSVNSKSKSDVRAPKKVKEKTKIKKPVPKKNVKEHKKVQWKGHGKVKKPSPRTNSRSIRKERVSDETVKIFEEEPLIPVSDSVEVEPIDVDDF